MVRGFSPVACDPSRAFETKQLRCINATAFSYSFSVALLPHRPGAAVQSAAEVQVFRMHRFCATQSCPSWHLPTVSDRGDR